MAEVKRVVAGVESSAMGRRVAERARMVAEEMGLPLHLVHVVEPVAEALIEPALAGLIRERQTEVAEELAAWCRSRSAVPVELEVVKGSPSWELASQSKSASLLVVGSSSLDAFDVGPTALRLARKATAHTLIVRRQPRVRYRRIVVAVDFSEASRVGVETALAMFPEAEVTLVFALTPRFDPLLTGAGLFQEELDAARSRRMSAARDRMEAFATPWAGRVRRTVVDGPVTEVIDETVRQRNADLVVVASRGATATRMVLLGTVAEGLLDAVPCDVLVARVRSAFRRP